MSQDSHPAGRAQRRWRLNAFRIVGEVGMALGQVLSAAVLGIEAYTVEVEVDLAPGLPAYNVVGLPDASVKESGARVKAALSNTGFSFPLRRITVNLAPAGVRKEGSAFDLPIALGILHATDTLQVERIDDTLILGELSLDGRVKSIRGALPIADAAARQGFQRIVVPAENAPEAAVVGGVQVFPAETLPQIFGFLNGELELEPVRVSHEEVFRESKRDAVDLSEVKGQHHAKRALEVASAGGHNILLIGPPGSGKSMLAKRLPTILPPMSLREAIEATKVHSVAGLLKPKQPVIATRPFRSPHHTISDAGLIGGGQIPMPGEVSLSHHGVLFLDELPEFHRNVLEVLRQPLEDGVVTISRAAISVSYPARFMLAAAMNPCPCGYLNDPDRACTCTPLQVRRYRSRISGPLMDRIDLHIEVPAVRFREMTESASGEPSAAVRERVGRARTVQRQRFADDGIHSNAQMSTRHLRRHCKIGPSEEKLLETAMDKFGISARAYTRILKVARTIADLAGSESIGADHLSEAIQYRNLDRQF